MGEIIQISSNVLIGALTTIIATLACVLASFYSRTVNDKMKEISKKIETDNTEKEEKRILLQELQDSKLEIRFQSLESKIFNLETRIK